ncbi:Serine/threonine-protein kinase [Rhodotorula mucilaginosa]|uniref:non-specific serine/threonine protein kinase n=1 Tax=Rhodotorula mucilaginosa TaxID=5537 RepID=A0A9P7B9G2_RHOMI|nr:Serine/threonine-protein kinase [Rhodotorula mucilaginosa]
MGAAVSQPQTASAAAAASASSSRAAAGGGDPLFAELAVHYDRSMGSSRFLKAVRARHRDGALVVKVFIKPDPAISLKQFAKRIKAEREALVDCPNVLPYARAVETERAGYLLRQWVASNLYDRISTRPFLSSVEKRWIAFQLLTGLRDARERGVSHGDIKTENVVVTSWNWAYLIDFSSSFKPTFLPLDDPSGFSFYFDTSSRRTCYLAPERFYAAGSDMAQKKAHLEFGKRDGKISEAMDVFSLGCVLAELWMEGTPPFTLSQLFKYRQGEYSLEPYLAEIEDVEIRSMIRSMLSLDPSSRLSFADYLTQNRGNAFPEIFYTFLHPFISSLDRVPASVPPPTAPTTGMRNGAATPSADVGSGGQPQQQAQQPQGPILLRTDADEKIERIWTEWEMVTRYLDESSSSSLSSTVTTTTAAAPPRARPDVETEQPDSRSSELFFPICLNLPGQEGVEMRASEVTQDGPALVVLSLVCANLRNCVRPASVLRALDILLALNHYLTDETRLDRLVPYLVAMLQDDISIVRATALRYLTQTLMLVTTLTPSNVDVFPEYVFPNTRPFSDDPEILPRETYALCIAALAQTSKRFLEMSEAIKSNGTFGLANFQEFEGTSYAATYESRLQELHGIVQDHLGPLLSDPSSAVKRALLTRVGDLCTFFGRLKANDAVLAHLVTYLNTRDWLLRKAWNEHAPDVASCVGARSLEEYILPLISLSLADPEEFVVVQVLDTLTTLASRRLLAKVKIWELVGQTVGFLCHPNIWIREASAAFLAQVATLLEPTDTWCILYPTVKRLLRSDVKEITALSLLDNAREPIARVVFETAVSWAGKAGKSNFWSLNRAPAKGAPREAGVRTDEDHAQLEKMRQLGMSVEDEYKLSALREYIAKVAAARQAAPSKDHELSEVLSPSSPHANLQDLGIVPQTIFFSVRAQDDALAAARSRLQNPLSCRVSDASAAGSPRSPASLDSTSRPHAMARVASGQPLDDLRRRLALNATTTHSGGSPSLQSQTEAASETSSVQGGSSKLSAPPSDRLGLHRTVSNASTEASEANSTTSVTSTSTSTLPAVPRSRVRLNAVEVGKVAPAVAEDTTNAAGLFDIEARYRESAADGDARSVAAEILSQSPTPNRRTSGALLPAALPQRFASTYDGHDPSIKQLLERTYLDQYREPLPELGPHVPVGVPRRKALRTNFPPRERTPSRPEGRLVAHLSEHTAAINAIDVAPDQLFFVTASEDGTVKVWDCMRLEKNVTSKSRQTYQQGGKIRSVCILEHSHCVASASTNGSVWIHRVDVSLSGQIPRYSKAHRVRQYTVDGGDHATCLASFNTDTTMHLILGTALSAVLILDVRTMRTIHNLTQPCHFGPITALCLDRKRLWLVTGSSTGTLALWDLRFGLLLRSWSVGARQIHQVALHPTKGKGRWIVVTASPTTEVSGNGQEQGRNPVPVLEVWDIDQGVKVEEFCIVPSASSGRQLEPLGDRTNLPTTADVGKGGMQDATLDPAAAIEALLATSTDPKPPTFGPRSSEPAPVKPTIRAMALAADYAISGGSRPSGPHLAVVEQDGRGDRHAGGPREGPDGSSGSGFILTGGEDRKLRFWDLGKPSRSAIVSGLEVDEEPPSYSVHTSNGRPSQYLETAVPFADPTPANPPSGRRTASGTVAPSTASAAPVSRVHRSTLIATSQQRLARAHHEAITALGLLELPFRCVVTGDRSGIVRVFE